MTLTEVVIGASLTSMILISGVGTFLVGMRSWAKGQTAIDTLGASQKGVRLVSNALREAMAVTVSSDGTQVQYTLPSVDVNGEFITPMVADGVARRFYVQTGILHWEQAGVDRIVCKDLTTTDGGSAYKYFTGGSTTLLRSLTMHLVSSKKGFRNENILSRSRETVYLRNIPQLSR